MLEDLQITFAMSEDFEYEWPEVMDDNKCSDDRAWFIGRDVFDTVDSQSGARVVFWCWARPIASLSTACETC